jgi:hypothetical protein
MTRVRSYEERIGNWLEEGAQTIPDWVVDDALNRAHATSQLGAGLRLPWIGRRMPGSALTRVVPLAVGALGALAVVVAFVLGLVSAPRIGTDLPSASPPAGHTLAPPSSPASTTPRPSRAALRPLVGMEPIDVLPGESADVYALIGIAATDEAVWTTAVTANPTTGKTASRLIRINAVTGVSQTIDVPGVVGMLSPPVASGGTVWTASAGGLHTVDASGTRPPRTVPLTFQPLELSASPDGLWIARQGGTTLVNPETGELVREISAHSGSRLGRIVGAPVFDSLWECAGGSVVRVDAVTGQEQATIELPPEDRDRCRRPHRISGVEALDGGILAVFANVIIDPGTNRIASEFDVGGEWTDVILVGDRLWFEVGLTDRSGGPGLVELDVASGQPSHTVIFGADLWPNTTFESSTLATAGGYIWILEDPTPGSLDGPQIIRAPESEL